MNGSDSSQPLLSDRYAQISVRGKSVRVPATTIDNRLVVARGRWLRLAVIHDEVLLDGPAVDNPEDYIDILSKTRFPADLFVFSQKLPDLEPRFHYQLVWDNLATITLRTYSEWWETQLPQETRKHVRKAAKQGLIVDRVNLDDNFVHGVVQIYNETPIRQGKPFPKYGQDFSTVKDALQIYSERSDFLGAYFKSEMIGFIKLVHMGKVSSILSINVREAAYHLKPTNALLAKAVEISCARGSSHLVYGRYVYGNKLNSSLTEFKRRHGFQKTMIPRYYVPLNHRGRIALRLGLHRQLLDVVPAPVLSFLERVRSACFAKIAALRRARSATAARDEHGRTDGD